jgi:DNA-binding phage protein
LQAHIPFKSKELKNAQKVIEALLECIRVGDADSFRDVLTAHLMTINKMAIARKAGIGRRTLYDLMDPKKDFNPELSTISSIMKALAA